ncbi:MAG: hypothetical protein ACLUA4_01580 [Bifidobacterium sp.]
MQDHDTLDSTPEECGQSAILDQSDKYAAKSDRADGAKSVTGKAGYDIVKNAEWLQDFYVNALAKAEAGNAADGTNRDGPSRS